MEENLPDWFVDLLLDFHNELKKGNNLDEFKSAKTATLLGDSPEGEHVKGYGFLNPDGEHLSIIGKRTQLLEGETQFFKHTTCLPKKEQ